MDRNIRVSVIVPVYGVEKYLRKCLDSLVAQTLKEMEIIVVNDSSPDNAEAIIREYAERYENITGLLKPNGGLSSARNYGLSYAKGEYIGFIDSDDYVEPDMFEKMLRVAEDEDCDLVVSDLIYTFENGEQPDYVMKGMSDLNPDSRKAAFLSPLFAWNKLYSRRFFDECQLRYPEGLWYEDIPVSIPCFAEANRVGYVSEAFVHYLQRGGSIMQTRNSKKLGDIFTELDKAYEYLRQHGYLEEFHDEMEYLYAEHLMVYGAFRFLRSNDYRELSEQARREIGEKFPNWKKNRYLKRKFSLKNRIFYLTNNRLTEGVWKKVLERNQ